MITFYDFGGVASLQVYGPDPFFAGSRTSNGSTGAHTLLMSADVQENDIVLVLCHTSAEALATPSGYTALTPQSTGTAATAGSVGLYAFWKRAGASEGNVSIADSGDHTISGLVLIRGCVESGDPFDVTAGDVQASASTSVVYPSVTTTVDNALILLIAAHGVDISTDTISIAANSSLCRLTQDLSHQSTTGTGGGFAVTSGLKRQKGATGTGSATTTSSLQARMTLALKPIVSDVPSFVGGGGLASGTAGISPAIPVGVVADDFLVLVVESANEPVAAPSGWSEMSSSPQGTGTAAGTTSTALQVFTKWATGSDSAPSVNDAGDHTSAQVFAFGGCLTGGSPIDVQTGNVEAAGSTAVTYPSVTSTVADDLVVYLVSWATDIASDRHSGFTGGNATRIGERFDGGSALGNGGGFALLTGHKNTAGATGTPTATLATSTVQGRIVFALKPA